MNNGKYSLILFDKKNNQKYIIITDEIEKEKVCISEIDSFTTKFQDKDELVNYLNNKFSLDVTESDIYIIYFHSKKELHREVMYNEYKFLPEFISDNKSKIENGSENFKKYLDYVAEVLNRISKDIELRKYILNSHLVNDKVKEYITNYLYKTHTIEKQQIRYALATRHLSAYKALRDLVFAIELYDNKKLIELINYKEVRRCALKHKPQIIFDKNEIEGQITMFDYQQELEKVDSYESNELYIPSQTYNDCEEWLKEGKELKEMIDLDDIQKLSSDEQKRLGLKLS